MFLHTKKLFFCCWLFCNYFSFYRKLHIISLKHIDWNIKCHFGSFEHKILWLIASLDQLYV